MLVPSETEFDTDEIRRARRLNWLVRSTSAYQDDYTAELRNMLVADQLRKIERADTPTDLKAILIIGLPASGKSTLAEGLAKAHQAAIIDSDEIKALLPEFLNGLLAGCVHEESSRIFQKVVASATGQGYNIVLPLVGRNTDKIRNAILDLRSNEGYEVHLILVSASPETCARRAAERFADTGRFVDPAYVLHEVGDAPSRTYRQIVDEGIVDFHAEVTTE